MGHTHPNTGIKLLAEMVCTGCGAALEAGLGSGVPLPTEPAQCLVSAVQHAKQEAWASGRVVAASEHAAAFAPLQLLGSVLADVFAALCKQSSTDSQFAKEETLSEADVEAGLWLAAVHFDYVAILGPGLTDREGAVTELVLQFVTRHSRAGLEKAAIPPTLEPRDAARSPGWSLSKPLAMALQSVHHALAAVRYMPMPAMHRVVPLAARFLVGNLSCSALQAAAANLLQAVLGQSDEQMQAMAVEQLTTASGSGRFNPTKRGPRQTLSPITISMLRAVCAPCLPTCTTNSACDAERGSGSVALADASRKAESRAIALIDGVLRRCLLGVRERERDPGSWAWLETTVQELLEASKDPRWVAAPLLLLCLTKGLARIAGAPRSVDMAWTQREFAVRLLGTLGSVLCREHTLACDYSESADLAELRRWAASAPSQRLGAGLPEGVPDEVHRLLISYLSAVPASSPVLCPPPCGCVEPHPSVGKAQHLASAVLPADHPAYSCSFLLCFSVASQAMAGGHVVADSRSTAPHKAAKRSCRKEKGTAKCEGDVPDWVLAEWSAAELCRIGNQPNDPKATRRHSTALPCSARLYRHLLHQDGVGVLARARGVALEALLVQIRSSSFAFVRRQAMAGLTSACKADVKLVVSRSVVEAIALCLQDESAFVRVAAVELMGHLLASEPSGFTAESIAECRTAVSTRLTDASPAVRRAAFRVACDTLHVDDPCVVANAANLLRRIQHETQQVRDTVLGALQHTLMMPPLSNSTLGYLVGLASQPGITGAGLRDLLKTHKAALETKAYEASVHALVVDAIKYVAERVSSSDVTPWTIVLEHLGAQHPQAVHSHIWQLKEWLLVDAASPTNAAMLAIQACRILSDVLPSWAAQVAAHESGELGRHLQDALTPLLVDQGSRLTRGAMECLCVVATNASGIEADVLKLFRDSMQYVTGFMGSRASITGEQQRLLCRHAWILGTTLEFLDIDALQEDEPQVRIDSVPSVSAAAVVQLLTVLSLRGPENLRPSLLPCLGFALRRHSRLLRTPGQGAGSSVEVFRSGLCGSSSTTTTGTALRAQATETLASLLATYEVAAQVQAPASGTGDWGAAVADCMRQPAISEAVQRLASLQPELLSVLGQAETPSIAGHALRALQSLSRLGVLHPSSAVPELLAVCMAGCQVVSEDARRFLLCLLQTSPQLLSSRLGEGLRRAVARLVQDRVPHGSLIAERWRFTAISEAYGELCESRRIREHLLDVLLGQFKSLSCPVQQEAAPAVSDVHVEKGAGWTHVHMLVEAELLHGILLVLPYRSELEVAYVLSSTARFLVLNAMPLVADGAQGRSGINGAALLGTCVASAVLHALCLHLGSGAGDVERLLKLGLTAIDGGAVEDQPLPAGFLRRPASDIGALLREAVVAAGDASQALSLVQRHVPIDSLLLRGMDGHGLGSSSRGVSNRRKRCSSGSTREQPQKRRRGSTGKAGKASQCKVSVDLGEEADAGEIA